MKKIVAQPGPDNNPRWSPDGKQIAFQSAMGETRYFARQRADRRRLRRRRLDPFPHRRLRRGAGPGRLESVPASTSPPRRRRPLISSGWIRAPARSFAFPGPTTLIGRRLLALEGRAARGLHGRLADDASGSLRRAMRRPSRRGPLTKMTEQAAGFTLGTREVISWKSQDGTTIEGVLIKPADFDPTKKYAAALRHPRRAHGHRSAGAAAAGRALLPVRHLGGTRGARAQGQLPRQRRLRREVPPASTIRNLGVGDAWDVLSGVDYLVGKGWVDPARVGCMGWSQGGYISAFLTDFVRRGSRRSPSAPASPTGRPTTTTPTSRPSRSSTWATTRSRIRRSTERPRRCRTSRRRRHRR